MRNLWIKICRLYHNHWWLGPLTIFLLWRLGLEIIGRTTLAFTAPVLNPWPADPNPPLWARWDSGWYSSILTYGYQLREKAMSNVTFFPLYPLLWKIIWLMTKLPRLVAGVLASNLAALGFCLIFFRWVQEQWNTNTAQRALVAILIFPASFFLIAAYSESTFILLVALAFLLAYRKQWLGASIAAALASAARPVGIMLWPTLLVWAVLEEAPLKNWRQFMPITVLPPLGLAAFSYYLWLHLGQPLAWLHGQAEAGRQLASPFPLLLAYTQNIILRSQLWARHLGETASLIFAVVVLPKAWRLKVAYGVFVVLSLLPPLLTNTLASLPRFTLMLLPLFVAVAQTKNRWLYLSYVVIATPLLIFNLSQYVTWQYAG